MRKQTIMLLSFSSDDPPNLMKLLKFKGSINIPQRIGTKYKQFGIFLLNDPMAARVNAIINERRDKAEEINLEILQKWLEGSGITPVTWGTLADVLDDIGLHTLGEEIRPTKK